MSEPMEDDELRALLDRISAERATMKPGEYPEEQPMPDSPSPSMEMEVMASDLVERLRATRKSISYGVDAVEVDAAPPMLDLEAADALEFAQSALATMRAHQQRCATGWAEALNEAETAEAQVLRLTEENEALRKERTSLIETKHEQIAAVQAIAAGMQKSATRWMRACMEAREGCNQRSEVIRKWTAKGEVYEARIKALKENANWGAEVPIVCLQFIADPCGSSKCAGCGKRRAEHRLKENAL